MENKWILTSEHKPRPDTNVEYSEDGITCEGTLDYKYDRRCMMAGVAGGNGYFSNLGFATDGHNGCDKNLVCEEPKYWRYYD